MTKVLYLEDENYLGRIVNESLSSRGYKMKLITDGAHVMNAYDNFQPDICILDVMVPNIDGFTLGKQIAEVNPDIPIIYLTAKNQTEDILEGFRSGGNDYIKKPFSLEELIVRIENLLQLSNKSENPKKNIIRTLGEYTFRYDKFELQHETGNVTLSHRENELMLILSENVNKQIDRRFILNRLWGDDSLYNSRNLDVYIRKLRVFFEKDPKIKITTLRGVGYYFSVE